MRPGGGWLAAQGRLPLAFMGLALVWLVAATVMLAARPGLLTLAHSQPHVVALVHAWVLGFLLTVACGAVYQLAPVALGTTLASERYGWWHFGLHLVGVPGMVWSFWAWDIFQLSHWGAIVGIGIILFSVNTWRTVHHADRKGLVPWSLNLAAGWLLLTVLVGLTLAANRFWHFIPNDPLNLLRMHAHLGLVGFFVTLLQGVAYQLVPMFTLGQVQDWRKGKLGLILSQAGLVVLAPGLYFHSDAWSVIGAVLVAAGIIISAAGLAEVLRTRKKRKLDPGVVGFLRGGAGLCLAAVAGIVLVFPGTPWGSAPGGYNAMVYGVLIFYGGLIPCIMSMMCKIVPFLTWMRAYGPLVGKAPTKPAGALVHPRVERWGLALINIAVAPLLLGAWSQSPGWAGLGAACLAAGVILFIYDMLGVLRHLRLAKALRQNLKKP